MPDKGFITDGLICWNMNFLSGPVDAKKVLLKSEQSPAYQPFQFSRIRFNFSNDNDYETQKFR